jgi:hypothetical protein
VVVRRLRRQDSDGNFGRAVTVTRLNGPTATRVQRWLSSGTITAHPQAHRPRRPPVNGLTGLAEIYVSLGAQMARALDWGEA